IDTHISQNIPKDKAIFDLFAGSGSVSYFYKDKYQVYSNDSELYSSIILDALMKFSPTLSFEVLKREIDSYIIENKDSSDHASFIKEGFDAITINDGDVTRIHTPEDKIEYISPTAIDRSFSVVWSEIFDSAYSSSGLFLLDSKVLILLILSALICLILKLKS
ncbi:MAG: DNA adenine methylase, partial [Clostridium perfringens]|nr:DNA adenine methylase [Clostridium perfringens]